MKKISSEKNISYSFVRALATICVIILHTCYMSVSLYGDQITKPEYVSSLTSSHILMVATPMFVMVTGALLLVPEKDISLKKLFGKYVLRLVLALFIFSFIYRAFDIVMSKGAETFSIEALGECLYEILTGTGWSHLWYIYMLLALYLLLPAFKAITRACDDKTILYIIVVGFIFMCVLPVIRKVGIATAFYIDFATVYPVYLLTGYAISKGIVHIKKIALPLFLAGAACIIAISIFRYAEGVEFLDSLLGYSSPITFITSVGLFGLLLQKNSFSDAGLKIISSIDSVSLEIYLIHIIFLRLILRYLQFDPYTGNLLTILLIISTALIALFLSMLTGHAIRAITKISKGRKGNYD